MPNDRATSLADAADPLRLYELAVQCPEAEIDFIDATYRSLRGRSARSLREDFCGSAAVCCEWVRRRKSNRALGVDLNADVLDWARRNNLVTLDEHARKRVRLVEGDVRAPAGRVVEVISAMNFSYWLLTDRDSLREYFRSTREGLKDDGVLFLDAFGGYDAFRCITEERAIEQDGQSFTYRWDQELYDPVTGRLVCHIDFLFPDGSEIRRAFSYDWRLWTLPEIRDLLIEAGFQKVQVYWQGWDENGEPDGDFKPVESADADAGWICYLTAEK